jgi:hypothetical protein
MGTGLTVLPVSHSHLPVTPLGDFTLPAARLLHVHTDLVGPHPTSAGYTYCLTAVHHFTHWPYVFPILDITANTVACTLLTGWISALVVHNHHQPETSVWISTLPFPGQAVWHSALTNNTHHLTANRLMEHFRWTMKAAIMCHADQHWTEVLPLVLLGIHKGIQGGPAGISN